MSKHWNLPDGCTPAMIDRHMMGDDHEVEVDQDMVNEAREEVSALIDWGKHPVTFTQFEDALDLCCSTQAYKISYPECLYWSLESMKDDPAKMMLIPWTDMDKGVIGLMVEQYVAERSIEIAVEQYQRAKEDFDCEDYRY